MNIFNFFSKKNSLNKKLSFFEKVKKSLVGRSKISFNDLDFLEEILIKADIGVDITIKLINIVKNRVSREKYINIKDLNLLLKEEILILIKKNINNSFLNFSDFINSINIKPYIILVVGVNGVGKTTTVAKLAYQFKKHNKKVIIGAADTFRAGAIDQILKWGEKIDIEVVSNFNKDPSSIVYDSIKKGIKNKSDIIIIDTAGRLHNKLNLMNELLKIKKVIQKKITKAPHEILLVLDATTGQNAFAQASKFTEIINIDSIAITKLDGTAKGGIVISIIEKFKIPIKYIGMGENINDLNYFNVNLFIDSFF